MAKRIPEVSCMKACPAIFPEMMKRIATARCGGEYVIFPGPM